MVYKKHCCYGLCTNDTRYPGRPEMEGVFFINFPKPKTNLEKCKRWIKNCGRPHYQFNVSKITKDTFICSKHFVGGKGPTDQHPDPIPATATNFELKKFNRGSRKQPKTRTCSTPSKKRQRKALWSEEAERSAAEALLDMSSSFNTTDITADNQNTLQNNIEVGSQTDPVNLNNRDAASQTEYTKTELQSKIDTMILRNELYASMSSQGSTTKNILSLAVIKSDEKQMKYFTGLTYGQFVALFKFLGESVYHLNYWNRKTRPVKIQVIEELFITLVRLRRGYGFQTMKHFFNICETALRCIFTTWLQLLYCHFKSIEDKMFPDRTFLKKFMPKSFSGFKNVRCSVDCTEFFVQMPRNLARQGNLYSNYKHHHTFKCLIAVAPNGTGVFCSDLFEGAVSDREIFEKSGILHHFNPGDLLLADRGFTVEDILMSQQVHLNIPPFLNGREKLTPQEELLTRKIAKARIHIERYNDRVKKFRLLSGVMPLNMTRLASQAVFVACCLVNFQSPLAT